MVGITAIFAFLGIFLGLVAGLWWGFSQSWLIGITATAGGAVCGGIAGSIAGFILEETPHWIDKFSKEHRVLGAILFWLFLLLGVVALGAFYYAGMIFVRHMRHHL